MWYQQQRHCLDCEPPLSCDLLENIYLCGINNNCNGYLSQHLQVVICLKISTFVVSTTTSCFATFTPACCDLLENIYLCGINNNTSYWTQSLPSVVICLKISTFVVSTTTRGFAVNSNYQLWFAWKYLPLWYQQQLGLLVANFRDRCDLLENIYLCGINNNKQK